MAKDPAFLFYPGDWLGGTMGMTFEEKGAYLELLILQFNRGHMTTHMMGHTVGHLLDNLLVKFEVDSEGKYFNRRLEEEKNKRVSYVKSRNNNVSGTNQYTKKESIKGGHKLGHMTGHMENENEDIDKGGMGGKDFTQNTNLMMQIVNNQTEHQTWIETCYRKYKLDTKKLGPALTGFNDTLVLTSKIHTSLKDYKQHFFNWMNTQDARGNLIGLKK